MPEGVVYLYQDERSSSSPNERGWARGNGRVWKLMKMLGFEDDDEYGYDDDYEEQPRPPRKQKSARRDSWPAPKLILFRGVPSEDMKRRLSEALKEGSMILLDLHELAPREFEEEGVPFITFMRGVAFARGGRTEDIESMQYLVTPHEGMFDVWDEEGALNDGAFDRQGR